MGQKKALTVPYHTISFCLFREEIQDFLNCIDASLEELQAMLSGKQYNFGSEAFSEVSVSSLTLLAKKYPLSHVMKLYCLFHVVMGKREGNPGKQIVMGRMIHGRSGNLTMCKVTSRAFFSS